LLFQKWSNLFEHSCFWQLEHKSLQLDRHWHWDGRVRSYTYATAFNELLIGARKFIMKDIEVSEIADGRLFL
jgi:hypothetical protein